MQDQAIIEAAKEYRYEVKGIKTFKGMEECGGFNATLYRAGVKVAFVINEDSGGSFIWRWLIPGEETKLSNLCATLPPDNSYGVTVTVDHDIFIEALVAQVEEKRDWLRRCKTHTCVILKSGRQGEYISFNRPYSPEIAKHIREKYGADLKEIVNERLAQEVAI